MSFVSAAVDGLCFAVRGVVCCAAFDHHNIALAQSGGGNFFV